MKNSVITQLISNIDKQQGIIGREKYLNTSVVIPIILLGNEYHILFEKRAAHIRQGGEVSFPGGEFDSAVDSNLKDTAIRETVEELGIKASSVNIIGTMGTLVAPMGLTLDVFVASLEIHSIDELPIDKNEVEKVFTIPVSFFKNNEPEKFSVRIEAHPHFINESGDKVELLPVRELGLPERYANPWKNGSHQVLVYRTPIETIWGLTAEIIYEFSKIFP
jgi:8-oxo-dGTP pyrophosphatase MutT (NUDIX family)